MPLRELTERKRLLWLIAVMVVISAVVATVWGWALYNTALEEQGLWLEKMVKSQAAMIETVAKFDVEHALEHNEKNAWGATMNQLAVSHKSFSQFGETGEFVLGRRNGDLIEFLMKQRHNGESVPKPVPINSSLAAPMRAALSGRSGIMIGADYQAGTVLAAFQPIEGLNVGLVAKMDMSEIRSPFYKVGLYSGLSALFIISLGGYLTHRISFPMVSRLETTISSLRDAQHDIRRLYQAIESSPTLVMITGQDGYIEYINPAFSRVTGYSRDEIIGKRPSVLSSGHTPQAEYAELWGKISSGQIWKGEFKNKRKDGSFFWSLTTISPVIADGEITNYTCIQEDITDRNKVLNELAERSEELSRSNKDLEQFAYVASHDLQEPLRAVASYTQLLAKRYEGQLDEKADKYIRHAHDGAVRMQNLIEGLLTYSRINTKGKSFSKIDCSNPVHKAIENLALAIEESKVEVVVGSMPTVMGDEQQLVMLFQNLIGNALKFRGPTLPRIEISAKRQGAEWCFCVADNGIGMESEFSERIFVIFQRLHIRSQYPGEGLGLAICKQIVQRHGGRIWVESLPSNGSQFYFTIGTKFKGRT